MPVTLLAALGVVPGVTGPLVTGLLVTGPLVARAAPDVTYFFPGGGQRGSTVEVTVGGSFPDWPVRVWASDPQVSVTPLEEKGKLTVEIGPAAVTGLVWLRLYDKQGAAAPRPWMIGAVAEVSEEEPNDRAVAAQHVSHEGDSLQTITVNGRLQSEGDADVYSLSARGGQTLVADLDAHATGASAFDGVLQVLDPDGFVLAHNDDYRKLDPHLAVEIPTDGRWMVRVFGFPETPGQQVQLAGNESYVYRLTLSTGPVVNYAMPLAARRDVPNRWQLVGWNLTDDLREISLTPPHESALLVLSDDRFGRTIRLPVVDCPLLVESEPNSVAEPTKIDLPVNITGRLDTPGDHDVFQFDAVKGETVLIEIESRELGYPLDSVLELLDASDKRLARVDDVAEQRDARIAHQVQEDGPLRVVVSDLFDQSGIDFVYRLSLERAKPSFRLATEFHQAVVKAGETTDLTITVERSHGFADPIEVRVEGLPDGVSASPATSKVGEGSDTAAKVVITLAAAKDAAAASAPIHIFGGAESDDASTAAHFAVPGHPTGLRDLWLTVTPPSD